MGSLLGSLLPLVWPWNGLVYIFSLCLSCLISFSLSLGGGVSSWSSSPCSSSFLRADFLISRWPLRSVLSSQPSPICPHSHTTTPPLPVLDVCAPGRVRSSHELSAKSMWPLLSFREASLKPWFHGEVLVSRGTAQPWTAHLIIFSGRGQVISNTRKASEKTEEKHTLTQSHLRGSEASGCVSSWPGCPLDPPSLCVDSQGQPRANVASSSWRTLELVTAVQGLLQVVFLFILFFFLLPEAQFCG